MTNYFFLPSSGKSDTDISELSFCDNLIKIKPFDKQNNSGKGINAVNIRTTAVEINNTLLLSFNIFIKSLI